jgi:hypothetical protein
MPGIDIRSSTAVRKGPRFASTCASTVAIAAQATRYGVGVGEEGFGWSQPMYAATEVSVAVWLTLEKTTPAYADASNACVP